ncbi:MAG: CAP domain-containing protein [Pseudomonadota bacterium]
MLKTCAVSALAAAAFAASAAAECQLDESGYPATAAGFIQTASSCLETPPAGVVYRPDLEQRLAELVNADRVEVGLKPLILRSGLIDASRLHAADMATSGYTQHRDALNRGHADRLRVVDRTLLSGMSGENIAFVPADKFDGDVAALLTALKAHPANNQNIRRDGFTHMGVGVSETETGVYLTQVFVRLEGELAAPMPASLASRERIIADFLRPGQDVYGWRLVTPEGETLAQRRGRGLTASDINQTAYLDVAVRDDVDDTVRYVRGPMLSGGQ